MDELSADRVESGDDLIGGVIAAVESGVELESYLALRECGAGHEEALDVWSRRSAVWHEGAYCTCRRAGAAHDDLIYVYEVGLDLDEYAEALGIGCTHNEILCGYEVLCDRVRARRMKESGGKLPGGRAVDDPVRLALYVALRRAGATHREAVGVLCAGGLVSAYEAKRDMGRGHLAALWSALAYTRQWRLVVMARSLWR